MRNFATRFWASIVFALAVAVGLGLDAGGGDGVKCARCGQTGGCVRTCRLVEETKKVQVTCWGCRSEEFCIPCRSTPGEKHCEMVCDDLVDATGTCTKAKKFTWINWIPGCGATLHTKKKLMKRTVTKTVPSYKWVVEHLCQKCQNECPEVQVEDASKAPLPPVVDAKRLPTAVMR